jgi:hypothetical protein
VFHFNNDPCSHFTLKGQALGHTNVDDISFNVFSTGIELRAGDLHLSLTGGRAEVRYSRNKIYATDEDVQAGNTSYEFREDGICMDGMKVLPPK